jgi:DNA-directed RNA polymerase specialized sigma24 family protein
MANIFRKILGYLNHSYTDEYGEIAANVLQAAEKISTPAESFALSTIHDADAGHQLMMKAAAKVTAKIKNDATLIQNLESYLFETYKRLIFETLRAENRRNEIKKSVSEMSEGDEKRSNQEIERKILLEQIRQRMSPKMRQIFEMLVLGYSFEEMATILGKKSNLLRSQYHKELEKIRTQLEKEATIARIKAGKSINQDLDSELQTE